MGIRNYRLKPSHWCPPEDNVTREVTPTVPESNKQNITIDNSKSRSIIDLYIKKIMNQKKIKPHLLVDKL